MINFLDAAFDPVFVMAPLYVWLGYGSYLEWFSAGIRQSLYQLVSRKPTLRVPNVLAQNSKTCLPALNAHYFVAFINHFGFAV